jgi:O-antigen/teichoic acid export membrane protein
VSTAAGRLAGSWPAAGTRRLLTLGAARGLASLLGFAAVLLVARTLDPAALGLWSLALAVQGYALHAAEWGLRGVVTTEAVLAGAALPRLLRRYLALRMLLAALVLAVVLAGAALLRPQDAFLIGLVTLSIVPIALQLDWIALADDRPGLAALPLVARPLGFLLLLGTSGPQSVAACYLASWWLAAGLSWPALRRRHPGRAGEVPGPARMLRRGLKLALVTFTNQLHLSADLLVVGWSLGLAAAGDYYLASQIAVAALPFANASSQITLSRLPPLVDRPPLFLAELRAEARRLGLLAAAIGAALALFGPPLLPLLFGAEHAGAAAALRWLLPWLLLQHVTTLLQGALTAAGRERAVLRANFVLLLVLLPALGLAGAAATLPAFAMARTAAELARLAALWRGLRQPRRRC